MSNHEMPPQALLDPGLAIVTTGNLRGPILSILRAACAPVKISEIIERYHPDMAPRVRTTINDLEYFGLIHQSSSHVTALRGTGNPYKRVEVREVVEIARPVQEDRYTVPMPTHTPEPRRPVAAVAKTKKPKPARIAPNRTANANAQKAAGRKYRDSIWPAIEALRVQGMSFRRISMETEYSHQTIAKTIKERVRDGWVDPCGDKFTPMPITDHDRALARNLRDGGSSIKSICKRIGRDRKSVLRALLEPIK